MHYPHPPAPSPCLGRGCRGGGSTVPETRVQTVEIVIPTWNGRKILSDCLPKVIECCGELDPPARITIVDDASTDSTTEYLRREFPQVNVLPQRRRHGFPGAVNAGAFASSADIILLINSDMIPHGPVLRPLIEHFEEQDVAAVSARVLKWDVATIDVGRRLRTFDRGEISGVGSNEDFPEPSYTFFASGGAMAVDRRRFAELGGFDEIYSPGYVEDTDFSYRAWKRGWKIAWEPRSTFLHMGSATFAPQGNALKAWVSRCRVRYLLRRNSFYFYWKNLTEPQARRDYWKCLPGRALKALLAGDVFYFAALARAAAAAGTIARLHRTEARASVVADTDVFLRLHRLCEHAAKQAEHRENAHAANTGS